ncbi:MAG: bacillithiol biosynthesis cysteine-adding enzyme BshC [Luteibaculaceae bacterium]
MSSILEAPKVNAEPYCSVPFSETGYFSTLISDYLNENPSAAEFSNGFASKSDFSRTINQKHFSEQQREVLVKSLLKQHQDCSFSAAKAPIIEQLKSQNTFTVTTGHQLNLFGGAAYTLYKTVSTLKLAEQLKQWFPDKNFIPVFWLASEDHDFQEIASQQVLNKRFTLKGDFKKHTGAIEASILQQLKTDFYALVGSYLELKPELKPLVDLWFTNPNVTLAHVTRNFIYQVFKDYPLLVVDGNCAELKKQVSPKFAQELKEQTTFHTVFNTNLKLKEKGYHIQVNPRDINLFYLGEHERYRISKKNGAYHLTGSSTVFTESEILTHLEANPEKFSPNALLRPLYQEVVLPNLAYVGGGGEQAYWLQLKETFAAFNVPFPQLVLRNSFLTVEPKATKKIEKLGLKPEHLFKSVHELHKILALQNASFFPDFNDYTNQLNVLGEKIKTDMQAVEFTLGSATEAALTRILKQVENLKRKALKAERLKNSEQNASINQLKNNLFPNGSLQERQVGALTYLLTYGLEIIPLLYKNTESPTKNFQVLTLSH